MANICKMLRKGMKNKHHSKPFYEKLSSELDNEEHKKEVQRMIEDEENSHEKLAIIAREVGCKEFKGKAVSPPSSTSSSISSYIKDAKVGDDGD